MIFTIHGRTDESREPLTDTLVAIPESNAKWAWILPPLWLARHRLWFALTVYILIGAVVLGLLFTRFLPAALLLAGIPAFYLYLEGNQLRRWSLERGGSVLLGIVDASSAEAAVGKYAADQAIHAPSADSRPTGQSDQRRFYGRGSQAPSFGFFPETGY